MDMYNPAKLNDLFIIFKDRTHPGYYSAKKPKPPKLYWVNLHGLYYEKNCTAL